jgi:hypothetical protein
MSGTGAVARSVAHSVALKPATCLSSRSFGASRPVTSRYRERRMLRPTKKAHPGRRQCCSPAAPCVQPTRLDVCISAALLACHTHIGDVAVRDGAGAVRHYARPRWWDRLRRDRNRINVTVSHLRGKVETAVSCESEGIRAVVLQRDGRTRCEAIQGATQGMTVWGTDDVNICVGRAVAASILVVDSA